MSSLAEALDLPNMKTFCDWLSETKVISVHDSFFWKTISSLLFSVIIIDQPPVSSIYYISGVRTSVIRPM